MPRPIKPGLILASVTLALLSIGGMRVRADEPATAPPHPLRAPLEKALQESRQQMKEGEEELALATLRTAAEAALAELDATSDAGSTLAAGLGSVQDTGMPTAAVKSLRRTLEDVLVALDYEPTVSADLPEGFPPPGKVGEIVIKQYPAYRGAWTGMKGKLDAGPDRLFWPLFQHIEKNEVAMTAPVEMRFPAEFDGTNEIEGEMSMAFLYGKPTIGEPGEQGQVTVRDEPAMTVVSIGLRGPYNARSMADPVARLRTWLEQHKAEYVAAGPPRRLAYNGPDVPARRLFSEVQIPVRPAQDTNAAQ
jgi:SOUL heme-binding protein